VVSGGKKRGSVPRALEPGEGQGTGSGRARRRRVPVGETGARRGGVGRSVAHGRYGPTGVGQPEGTM
jgi:hypothetical protein